ncbi:hypothetical protein SDC9_149970 [bioreactor metagenome]|uniref:Uncharacterized protein n=1 Tax=bioreactor metagenome TaxID=1076179 RepID=A0A645EQ74_9ZZZZ|nr:hypothetical protein [Oscillospiraceae bacterium]
MSYLEELFKRSTDIWKKMEERADGTVSITVRSSSPVLLKTGAGGGRGKSADDNTGETVAAIIGNELTENYMTRAAVSQSAMPESGTEEENDGEYTAMRLLHEISRPEATAQYPKTREVRGTENAFSPDSPSPAYAAGELSRMFERDARRCGEAFILFE